MSSDDQVIRELVIVWLAAAAAGDVVRLRRLMDEDASFESRQFPMCGREAFIAAFAAKFEKTSTE